jgi:hypothetical protein
MFAKMLQTPLGGLTIGRTAFPMQGEPLKGPTPFHRVSENGKIAMIARGISNRYGMVGM